MYNQLRMGNIDIAQICKRVRYDILRSSTAAGSGHPSSSLSAVELMTTLFFGGYLRYDLNQPGYPLNDRVIFSKGHASPLFYSLYAAAGALSREELMTFRKIDSNLEGHPTPRFKYTEASTGSLGQGLSVGIGMALAIRLRISAMEQKPARIPHVFVLLGDSESAEGQVWEALEIAAHYKLDHLVGILDVNRLGQRGETMTGWDTDAYRRRIEALGWNTVVVENGHDLTEVHQAFDTAERNSGRGKPIMIIAKTMKGKGVSAIENKDNWHGKPLTPEMLKPALAELGEVQTDLIGNVIKPEHIPVSSMKIAEASIPVPMYDKPAATREAYGDALVALGKHNETIVVLDAEVSNSTYAEKFKLTFPDRFFEMYIAEQNMVSVAVGLAKMGFMPYVSSFAAFLTRAFDQIRMAQYSDAHINVVGSHAGVSIGQDGSSQMGLEDLSMMQSILKSVVLYPSDAVSTVKLAELMSSCNAIGYLRLTREKTQTLYSHDETFKIGGSKVLKSGVGDKAVIIGAGITLHEALAAHETLDGIGIKTSVIDAYSVKPIDTDTIVTLAKKTGVVVVVEDHYPYGGLGAAVAQALIGLPVTYIHLCVQDIPHSGAPTELMAREHINAAAIVDAVRKAVR